ncbi:hypothetical protein RB195_021719 [Necator americanus]|uniref:Uncharacterized protein n=1 Tax=Necator americanus TaxID=51031 RepID=A0ABR1EDD6_NECAM
MVQLGVRPIERTRIDRLTNGKQAATSAPMRQTDTETTIRANSSHFLTIPDSRIVPPFRTNTISIFYSDLSDLSLAFTSTTYLSPAIPNTLHFATVSIDFD